MKKYDRTCRNLTVDVMRLGMVMMSRVMKEALENGYEWAT